MTPAAEAVKNFFLASDCLKATNPEQIDMICRVVVKASLEESGAVKVARLVKRILFSNFIQHRPDTLPEVIQIFRELKQFLETYGDNPK